MDAPSLCQAQRLLVKWIQYLTRGLHLTEMLCYSPGMGKSFIAIGACLGFLSVASGAFGAHILRSRMTPDNLVTFEIAARYQMYHALAIILVGLLSTRASTPLLNSSGWLFFYGSLVFSGSLYLLSWTGVRWLGAITPIGGILLLCGWACLFIASFRG